MLDFFGGSTLRALVWTVLSTGVTLFGSVFMFMAGTNAATVAGIVLIVAWILFISSLWVTRRSYAGPAMGVASVLFGLLLCSTCSWTVVGSENIAAFFQNFSRGEVVEQELPDEKGQGGNEAMIVPLGDTDGLVGDERYRAVKCDWLRLNFPQTPEAVQALGASLTGEPTTRISPHIYPCNHGPTSTVYDGFVVLGPAEIPAGGSNGSFRLAVPVTGVIDVYAGATCSGRSEVIGPETDTVRCFNGEVKGVRATYWPWYDQKPPVDISIYVLSAEASIPANASVVVEPDCQQPTLLADSFGWTYSGSPDQYGGLVVEVATSGTLPNGWMAQTLGSGIGEYDPVRVINAGFWTIYPPYACRAELGYSQ